MKRIVLAALVAAAPILIAPEARAQEEPQPGIVAVGYYKCSFVDLQEAVDLLNVEPRQAARAMIDEGKLIDFGILTHSWGDEWNLVIFFVATDVLTFHSAFDEWVSRLTQMDPQGEERDRFFTLCPEHKDNIYSVVPPPGGAPGS